jgi:hypothetical protein
MSVRSVESTFNRRIRQHALNIRRHRMQVSGAGYLDLSGTKEVT